MALQALDEGLGIDVSHEVGCLLELSRLVFRFLESADDLVLVGIGGCDDVSVIVGAGAELDG